VGHFAASNRHADCLDCSMVGFESEAAEGSGVDSCLKVDTTLPQRPSKLQGGVGREGLLDVDVPSGDRGSHVLGGPARRLLGSGPQQRPYLGVGHIVGLAA
jgi:hypothetical protein